MVHYRISSNATAVGLSQWAERWVTGWWCSKTPSMRVQCLESLISCLRGITLPTTHRKQATRQPNMRASHRIADQKHATMMSHCWPTSSEHLPTLNTTGVLFLCKESNLLTFPSKEQSSHYPLSNFSDCCLAVILFEFDQLLVFNIHNGNFHLEVLLALNTRLGSRMGDHILLT